MRLELLLKTVNDIVNDEDFWEEIAQMKRIATSSIARRLIVEGARAAESVGVIVDFDVIHREAVRIAQTTSSRFWATMTDVEREVLSQSLITWQETGLGERGLPDLIDSLEPLFGRTRAKRIAATESTRLFGDGNRLACQLDDVSGGLEWQTAHDERVCEICAPRDGLIYPKDTDIDLPAHVNCRCALIPVSWRFIQRHQARWQGGHLAA